MAAKKKILSSNAIFPKALSMAGRQEVFTNTQSRFEIVVLDGVLRPLP